MIDIKAEFDLALAHMLDIYARRWVEGSPILKASIDNFVDVEVQEMISEHRQDNYMRYYELRKEWYTAGDIR